MENALVVESLIAKSPPAMNKFFSIVLALMCFGFSEPDEVSNFDILPILKFSIEMGQSNTGLGTSFSYGILIGKSISDDWVDASYGVYWYKTLSLKNIQNYKELIIAATVIAIIVILFIMLNIFS